MTNNQQSGKSLPAQPKKPNEKGSIAIAGFVKIFDPKTKQTYVETRA